MSDALLRRAACVADLKSIAQSRIPKFAYQYLTGGCNDDCAVRKNREALDAVLLKPSYLSACGEVDLSVTLFGRTYSAPFGIAPLGLSGLIWPRAAEFLAQAAHKANIPFVLSTLASTSIEIAAEHARENFWFQLYPPSDLSIRADLIRRAQAAGCQHLVVTIDVPTAGRRPKDIKNGLSVPPRITPRSAFQVMMRPAWALATARTGMPQFASMAPYMKNLSNLSDVANYVRTALKDVVDGAMLRQIRDSWPGKLIVKGISHIEDAEVAIEAGVDGLIVSNHGGRQLDAAEPSINTVAAIASAAGDRVVVMADSGVTSGPDIARFLARGAQLVFAGRAFTYGVGAFGEAGAEHTIDILRLELLQVLEQLRCSAPAQLREHLV
jgi:L-lactate dehydrogenase (cytochrome)